MLKQLTAQCCIAGGGPAGMMAGYLLARAGIETIVLEKHADFLRDFRGDTIHPSTMQILDELGLYERFLSRPHQEVPRLKGRIGNFETVVADFSHLPTRAKFLAFVPQWDFLDFLAEEARAYPSFQLMMETEVTSLIKEGEAVKGVIARTPEGEVEIRSELVLGCDGRHSTVRKQAGLPVKDIGAPMDVLWFRLSRRQDDPEEAMGTFGPGHVFIMINRGDYWQCGYVIAKGSLEEVRRRGIEAFRADLEKLAPFLCGRSSEVKSFDDIKLLTVGVDRLTQWHRPGLLCIGDAAHTMSPVGGVGINLAVQDAVAAANIVAPALRCGSLTEADLAKVQKRREFPTRLTQAVQVQIQKNVIGQVLKSSQEVKPPFVFRLLKWLPWLARIPARIIGLGFRPEHADLRALGR
jgi:2-polyprenyl-6-methoxyphenol hydroxylase-like FAD-dependent oxidoreductase